MQLINQDFGGESDYRWGGATSARFCWPLEQIDRKLRPDAWQESFPLILDVTPHFRIEEEEEDRLGIEALETSLGDR